MSVLSFLTSAAKWASPIGPVAEVVGDVAGAIDYLNRQYGFLPNWAADVVDVVDDLGLINSLAELTGISPSGSYGSALRGPAESIGSIAMFLAPGMGSDVAKFARVGLAQWRPFDVGAPAPVNAQNEVEQAAQQGGQQPDEMTMPDVMAQAIIAQAIAEAQKQHHYAKWLQTQQQMADLYTKWQQAYPRMYEEAVRKYYGLVW